MGNDPDFLGLGGYNSSASGAVSLLCWAAARGRQHPQHASMTWVLLLLLQMAPAHTHLDQTQMTAGEAALHAEPSTPAQPATRRSNVVPLLLCLLLCPCSVDSAELRAAEAAARLKDYGATSSQPKQPTGLPSALDAFTEVGCPPVLLRRMHSSSQPADMQL